MGADDEAPIITDIRPYDGSHGGYANRHTNVWAKDDGHLYSIEIGYFTRRLAWMEHQLFGEEEVETERRERIFLQKIRLTFDVSVWELLLLFLVVEVCIFWRMDERQILRK